MIVWVPRCYSLLLLLLTLSPLSVVGCSGDLLPDECAVGEEGCPCLPDNFCEDALICLGQICRSAPEDSSEDALDTDRDAAGEGAADASNEAGASMDAAVDADGEAPVEAEEDASPEAGKDGCGREAGSRCNLARGAACESAAQCASDYCVDGVCCEVACDGSCDRCNIGDTGECQPDDALCGNCGVCAEDGRCEPDAAACGGDCSACEADGDAFRCAPVASACPGACAACQGSGSAFSCADVDGLCGACMKCTAGLCVNQSAAEDLKGDCFEDDCNTGLCDGAGACATLAAGTLCADGICQRCDGAGACVATDTHDDCGVCQMCNASGACVSQGDGQDVKEECELVECKFIVAGWNSEDSRICSHFGKASRSNGACDGQGGCRTWETVCRGVSVSGPSCGSLECRRMDGTALTQACVPGASTTENDEIHEICFVSGESADCPSSQVCNAEGVCVPK